MGYLERTWISLKHNNFAFGLNKVISILVSLCGALITIVLRAGIPRGEVPCDTEDYKFLFWMLFIYYSFHALGEMLEIYLVKTKTSKGLVGMLFDMNYFAGLYITYRVLKAVYSSPQCQEQSPFMFKWLVVQIFVFYAVAAVTFLIFICQWRINSKVSTRRRVFNKAD